MSEPADEAVWLRLAQLAEVGMLSASVLHELRQPLFAVKAMAQLARRRGERLDQDQIGQLLVHVTQIEELLDHYVGFGGLVEPPVIFDLNATVRAAIDMLAHRARQLRFRLDTDLTADLLWVHGRASAARQVVVNLLQNAYDAVEDQRERSIRVASSDRDGMASLVIHDNGPGIPGEVSARIGEPFVTTKGPGRGTGLGLYITQRLVSEASGHLDITVPPEGGTRVEVRLPVATGRYASGSPGSSPPCPRTPKKKE